MIISSKHKYKYNHIHIYIYTHSIDDHIKKYTYTVTKSSYDKFLHKANSDDITKEFSMLKQLTDDEDVHYKSLANDSDKNRYSDIKPCKYLSHITLTYVYR